MDVNYSLIITIIVIHGIVSCRNVHQREESVIQSMKKYEALILRQNDDAIAAIYTMDGELGQMAKGRDSIKAFLARFQNIKILSQSSVSDSVTIEADTVPAIGNL